MIAKDLHADPVTTFEAVKIQKVSWRKKMSNKDKDIKRQKIKVYIREINVLKSNMKYLFLDANLTSAAVFLAKAIDEKNKHLKILHQRQELIQHYHHLFLPMKKRKNNNEEKEVEKQKDLTLDANSISAASLLAKDIAGSIKIKENTTSSRC